MNRKIYSIVSIVALFLSGFLFFACSGKVSKNSSDIVEDDTINPLENAIISELSVADNPQSDIDILKYYCWTDGDMIYTYRNTEVDADNNQIQRYFFNCSTVNEMSNALMCIEVCPSGWKSVSPTSDKYYKLTDCIVSLNINAGVLIFADPFTEQIDVLVPMFKNQEENQTEKYKNFFESRMAQLLLEGKFQTMEGETVVFNPEKMTTDGSLFGKIPFTFGYAFDMPAPVLIINSKTYYIEKLYGYLNLFLMKYKDQMQCTNGERAGEVISIERRDDNIWPLLTERVLTKNEIYYYAGYNIDGPYNDEEISDRMAFRNDMLSTMRNTILARHGYIFQEEVWQRTFGSLSWYKPLYDNVDDKLTDIEKINIQILESLEVRRFD
ncbi:MAG: YARHG domain-containing protein [Candidatus Aphodosoma sp.]